MGVFGVSEIPEDIKAAARAAAVELYTNPDGKSDELIIARAILAERKRCAEIANSRGSPGHFMNVRRDICNAVNSGEQP